MRRLTSPGWLLRHAAVLVVVGAFGWLGWWQIGRAAGGNALSFGYAIEWPFFGAFVIFLWVREMRATLRARHDGRAGAPSVPPQASAEPAPGGVRAFDATAAMAARAARDREHRSIPTGQDAMP
jgi:hypothetical protein